MPGQLHRKFKSRKDICWSAIFVGFQSFDDEANKGSSLERADFRVESVRPIRNLRKEHR